MTHLAPYFLRAWDVLVASTPLFAALLAGSFLWKYAERRIGGLPRDSFPGIFLAGGTAIQFFALFGALFSSVLASAVHFATFGLGCLSLGLLLWSPGAIRLRLPIFGMALVRGSAFLGLMAGFAFAGSDVPGSISSDAIAYHIPIASWFARGNAWPQLPNHIWTAQWPLASSLWSSFVMGRLPVTDRLVAWSAQNYAFLVWTASLVFAALKSLFADRRGAVVPWMVSLSLLTGAYSGYQRMGFVDYGAGLFSAALIATLVELPVSFRTLPLAIGLASVVAEFRPQGLLFSVALLLCWLGISMVKPRDEVVEPASSEKGVRVGAGLLSALAGLIFVKWWILVWARWGTPAPPVLARRLNLSPTLKYADELFYYLWTADLRKGLKLVLPGNRDTCLVAFLFWALVLLAVLAGWRRRESEVPEARQRYRLIGLVAILSPAAACVFLATRVPSEGARLMAPMIPALCIVVFAVLRREGLAFDRAPANRMAVLMACVFLFASLLTARLPWSKPYQEQTYPTRTTDYFSQMADQLDKLRNRRPLLFDQYIAFLPVGFKQMGITYGPWAGMPKRPLRTLDAWMEWLRENGVGILVVQVGKELKSTWDWTQERTETPDFSVLDQWVPTCPDREVVGLWVGCPVLGAGRPGNREGSMP